MKTFYRPSKRLRFLVTVARFFQREWFLLIAIAMNVLIILLFSWL